MAYLKMYLEKQSGVQPFPLLTKDLKQNGLREYLWNINQNEEPVETEEAPEQVPESEGTPKPRPSTGYNGAGDI